MKKALKEQRIIDTKQTVSTIETKSTSRSLLTTYSRGCLKTPNTGEVREAALFLCKNGRRKRKNEKANKTIEKWLRKSTEKGKRDHKPAGKSFGINKAVPKRSFWIL